MGASSARQHATPPVQPEKIVIELSPAQVDRVVRGAADGGNISVLLSGLQDVREVLAREPSQLEDSRLSRSLLAGLLMLASFPTDGTYLGNAEIARMLDMNPSTTHRYVSTLVAVGLLDGIPPLAATGWFDGRFRGDRRGGRRPHCLDEWRPSFGRRLCGGSHARRSRATVR